jgi:hypothetical protein
LYLHRGCYQAEKKAEAFPLFVMERTTDCGIDHASPVMEDDVKPRGPDDGQAHKTPLTVASSAQQPSRMPWPWGLVAIGFMALAWVGIYLVWQGILFLLNL